ncbi:hypothetical protein PENCOP_c002G04065 [Penicillium coprophilum]|uniref:Uncharacterized protein n=1 Tax=Penicillium coprophilum TaxID=36646 RepID=A0A1V6V1S7_9EURO|nr:hypothetical protein PENCOP_c002G04065 [Penicillium coprophilum]
MHDILPWKEPDGHRPTAATAAGIDCHSGESTAGSGFVEPDSMARQMLNSINPGELSDLCVTQNVRKIQASTGIQDAYFKERTIVGPVFVYMPGKAASTGDFDTEACQAVSFPLNTRIVGFSAAFASAHHKFMEIEFDVEWNEQPWCHKRGLSTSSPQDVAHNVDYKCREVWCKDDPSAESERLLKCGRVYKALSESRLVGIDMGCQEFSRVGALYEPCDSQ